MSHPARLGLALVAAALAAGCAAPGGAQAPSAQTVAVDSCGKRLTFAGTPQRAVALDQNSTETMLALGLQDRMVGTANLKTKVAPEYAAAYAKVPVLSPKVLTSEPLRAANPDVVVSSFREHFTPDRAGTRDELESLGVPTFVSAVNCPDGTTPPFERLFRDYENLGKIFGATDRADRLAAEQRAAVKEVEATKREPVEVVWIYSVFKGVPYVAGRDGMPSQMSKIAGAVNVFDDLGQEWPEASWEEIARRDPDVIVIGDLSERGNPGDKASEKLAMMREHPVVSQLTALRENKVIELPGIEMDPSVRTVNALRSFGAGLDKIAGRG
ncbi:iron complex transport system substrate-binding protein [Lentzea xinjiangensis]|uniref:Iron complex transport system substrate-binding protein n=1 Tax=Lentzea xinjiangensis TaxID=402600 RepID=A0A1H9VHL7_9PSEU|nr:ABC transporter substrate-binding protein [Lentzea xinjiangensis]SES21152.1 iron complex transport system substrate-binding protein [Lentzea xinjiangensis]